MEKMSKTIDGAVFPHDFVRKTASSSVFLIISWGIPHNIITIWFSNRVKDQAKCIFGCHLAAPVAFSLDL